MTQITLPDLTIPSTGTVSNEIGPQILSHLSSMVIKAPDTLAGVVTIEVTHKDPEDAAAGDWETLQEDGADLNITAGDAVPVEQVGFKGLRLVETVSPGSDEVFTASGKEDGSLI